MPSVMTKKSKTQDTDEHFDKIAKTESVFNCTLTNWTRGRI